MHLHIGEQRELNNFCMILSDLKSSLVVALVELSFYHPISVHNIGDHHLQFFNIRNNVCKLLSNLTSTGRSGLEVSGSFYFSLQIHSCTGTENRARVAQSVG